MFTQSIAHFWIFLEEKKWFEISEAYFILQQIRDLNTEIFLILNLFEENAIIRKIRLFEKLRTDQFQFQFLSFDWFWDYLFFLISEYKKCKVNITHIMHSLCHIICDQFRKNIQFSIHNNLKMIEKLHVSGDQRKLYWKIVRNLWVLHYLMHIW